MLFQTPTSTASPFANKWLSYGSGSEDYSTIMRVTTLSHLLRLIIPTGLLARLAPSVVAGRSVIGIRGELPGDVSGTLYVSAAGSPLPVEVSATSSGTTTAVFSDWGESVSVASPTGAIPGRVTGLS